MTLAVPIDSRSATPAAHAVRDVGKAGVRTAPGTKPVVRRRLLDALDRAVEGGVTVITAPMGYGKTVLLESWLSAGNVPGRVVRLVCDETDRLPDGFWRHLVHAVSRDAAPLWPAELFDPMLPRPVPRDAVDVLAGRVKASDRPVVLVLDEAERLSPPVLEDLGLLVRRGAPALHLVLAGRETPSMKLPHDPARAMVTRVTMQDLAFSAEETRQLLDRHGICLGDDALSELVGATEGWAAALQRAAVELNGTPTPDATVHALASSRALTDGHLADVLDAQPVRIRRFLLATSVADRLWPGLAAALSGEQDAAGLLTALVRANLFIHVSPEGGRSYAYEPMFRAMLTARLAQAAPQGVWRLHATAARWLAGAGRLTEAATHFVRIGDWSEAAALVVEDLKVGALGLGGGPLPELFADLPESAAGPEVAVVRASLHLCGEDRADGAERAQAALALALAEDRVLDRSDSLRLAVGLVEVQLAQQQSDPRAGLETVHAAETLIAAQPAALVKERPELVATLLAGKGALQLRRGDLEDAVRTLSEGFEVAVGESCATARLACASRLALAEALRGRLAQATEWATAAEALAAEAGGPDPAVRVARAWVHTEQYAVRQAHDDLHDLPEASAALSDPVVVGALALVRSRLARAEGDLRGAIRVIQHARSQAPLLPVWLDQRLRATAASLHVAAVDGVDVARLADPSAASAALDVQVEGWLGRADRALSRGETRRARSAVEQALRLAEPERLRRPVAEAPPRLRQFLATDSGLSARRQWLGAVGADQVAGLTEQAAPPLVEPLTLKEREVLDHLSALLSTEEIAQTMFVSVNTVRSHVRSILRKLSATRRNEAVRRARDLGLVDR